MRSVKEIEEEISAVKSRMAVTRQGYQVINREDREKFRRLLEEIKEAREIELALRRPVMSIYGAN